MKEGFKRPLKFYLARRNLFEDSKTFDEAVKAWFNDLKTLIHLGVVSDGRLSNPRLHITKMDEGPSSLQPDTTKVNEMPLNLRPNITAVNDALPHQVEELTFQGHLTMQGTYALP